jgi:hypothetical protein
MGILEVGENFSTSMTVKIEAKGGERKIWVWKKFHDVSM